jgi:hypothetical protein
MTILLNAIGVLLLLVALGLGYWRWIYPRRAALDWQSTGLLLLLLLTLMGGFIGAPFWWANAQQAFSWRLPPLAGRMLAAAAWAFVVACVGALEKPTRQRVQLALTLVAVYLVPLLPTILLFHLDRFNFGAVITYEFFLVVVVMSVASIWYLLRQPDIPGAPADEGHPDPLMTLWLIAIAVVTFIWGMALFGTDAGPSPLIWVWRGDLLTSRLIAVMLLTIAVGGIVSLRDAGAARLMLAVIVTYGVGVALANLWSAFLGKPISASYLLVFAVLAAGSAALLARERLQVPTTNQVPRVT